MKIEMPTLPYATNALEPVISEQTINFHYGKHLQNYVNTLTSLVKDTEWAAFQQCRTGFEPRALLLSVPFATSKQSA